MNIESLKHFWYPIMEETKLGIVPIAKKLLGTRIVLARLHGEIICFEDRCPHRNVPLSDGNVTHQHLKCSYHGWEFESSGNLSRIPGCNTCSDTVRLNKYQTHSEDGMIWVLLEGTKTFENPFKNIEGFEGSFHFKSLKSDFIHTIENFLDPTHTPFIHKGLLRNEFKQRMEISQESDENGFVTRYTLLDQQNGLINRLLDSGIDKNIASFTLPGYAVIDYVKEKALQLQVAIFFVPIDKGEVDMVVRVSVRKSFIPASLKFLLLKPFMELAFRQDKIILEKHYITERHYNKPYVIGKCDLVIDHLIYLLSGGSRGISKTMSMEL